MVDRIVHSPATFGRIMNRMFAELGAPMASARRFKFLIALYIGALITLLLSVIATPVVIQHGLAVTRTFIIEEELLESSLIVILFGVSAFMLRGFKRILKGYERAVDRAVAEKSKIGSQLSEAFNYIGSVNVELQAIKSILCGVEHYPQTKKEFKRLIDQMADKAMTIAGTPWVVIRMISRSNGRTVKEYARTRLKRGLPSITMGNRKILENRPVAGMQKVSSCQKNLDLLTVCILPTSELSEEEIILITAITNQVEMFFTLYRAGFPGRQSFSN